MKKLILLSLSIICLYANSDAQTFIEYTNNPVIDTLQTNDSSEFWTRWKSDPCVIHWGTDSLRMYYGTNNYGISTQIGTAVSADGNTNWVEKRDAPVLSLGSPGNWDDTEVETPYVIYISTNPDSMKYMMWYSGATLFNNWLDTACFDTSDILYQIGLAYSNDGLNWTKYNNHTNDSLPLFSESDPVITIPPYVGCTPTVVNEKMITVVEPCVLYESCTYKMYHIGWGCSDLSCFQANPENLRFRVLYAESTDGINWGAFNVILDVGDSTGFDSKIVYSPDVIKVGSEYWMFYAGDTTDNATLFECVFGLATSTDGINFTKLPANPVITKGLSGTWNAYGMNAPSCIIYHDTLRAYYTGVPNLNLDSSFVPGIGYSYLDSLLNTSIPGSFDNSVSIRIYPNPFKSFAILEFENLKNKKYTLTLFDITGKLIRTIKALRFLYKPSLRHEVV